MVPLEGPVFVGTLVDAIMLGGLIVQSCVFYKNSKAGTWMSGILVSVILLLSISHLVCTAAWLWQNELAATADVSVVNCAAILFGISNVFSAIILLVERCFFTQRILKVSKNHLVALLLFIFCIFAFTAAVGAASVFFTNSTAGLTSQPSGDWIFPLVVLSALVCDLAISATTAFYLGYQTPSEAADVLGRISRLFLLVAETGIVTGLFDVAVVIVYWSTRSNLAWIGSFVCVPGVFANALLAALNARGHLCADIEHQRIRIGENLIDNRAKRPPIMINISERLEKRPDKFSSV